MTGPTKYRCALCGGEFLNTRTDVELEAEFHATFPETCDTGARDVVCDDCWELMLNSSYPPAAFERDVREGRIDL